MEIMIQVYMLPNLFIIMQHYQQPSVNKSKVTLQGSGVYKDSCQPHIHRMKVYQPRYQVIISMKVLNFLHLLVSPGLIVSHGMNGQSLVYQKQALAVPGIQQVVLQQLEVGMHISKAMDQQPLEFFKVL